MKDIYLIHLEFVYSRTNTVLNDLISISCDIKTRFALTYCLDLYGSCLYNYCKYMYSASDMLMRVACRKAVYNGVVWSTKLPHMTYWNFFIDNNSSFAINNAL